MKSFLKSQAEWLAQQQRAAACVAQCDHVATPEEVAQAAANLDRELHADRKRQGDLL